MFGPLGGRAPLGPGVQFRRLFRLPLTPQTKQTVESDIYTKWAFARVNFPSVVNLVLRGCGETNP